MSRQLEIDETRRAEEASVDPDRTDTSTGTAAGRRGAPSLHRRGAALLMAGLAVAGLLAGLVLNLVSPPTWTATSTVLVQWRPADVVTLLLTGTADDISADDLGDVSGLVASAEVLDVVSARLPGQPSAADLAQVVTATAVASSHLVTIQATDDTRAGAVRIAEAVSSVLAQQQQDEVTQATTDLPSSADLDVRGSVVAARVEPVRVLGDATVSQTAPTLRTPLALAVVGFALGGLLVIALSLRGRDLRLGGS